LLGLALCASLRSYLSWAGCHSGWWYCDASQHIFLRTSLAWNAATHALVCTGMLRYGEMLHILAWKTIHKQCNIHTLFLHYDWQNCGYNSSLWVFCKCTQMQVELQ
jgi:hypothetical protein